MYIGTKRVFDKGFRVTNECTNYAKYHRACLVNTGKLLYNNFTYQQCNSDINLKSFINVTIFTKPTETCAKVTVFFVCFSVTRWTAG